MRLLIALLVNLTLKHSLIATCLITRHWTSSLICSRSLPGLSASATTTGISTDTRIRNLAVFVCHEEATRPTAMAIDENFLSADITRARLSVPSTHSICCCLEISSHRLCRRARYQARSRMIQFGDYCEAIRHRSTERPVEMARHAKAATKLLDNNTTMRTIGEQCIVRLGAPRPVIHFYCVAWGSRGESRKFKNIRRSTRFSIDLEQFFRSSYLRTTFID